MDIRDFGAIGDGRTLNTEHIQAALDACRAGGGTVEVPPGDFLTGTIRVWDNTTLYFSKGARLIGSSDLRDYSVGIPSHQTPDISWEAILFAVDAHDIVLTGEGILEGQGHLFPLGAEAQSVDDTNESEERIRPSILFLKSCSNIILENIHLENAAQFATLFEDCRNIVIQRISVHNRGNQNTDGLHFSGCEKVQIDSCHLDCGDDAIVFNKYATDCAVQYCDISSRWAGVRVGPFSAGELKHIKVTDCRIHDTYGCAIKIQTGEGGKTHDLLFENLSLENVTGPIHISLTHFPGWRVIRTDDFEPGAIKDVVFRNIRATTVERAMPTPIEVPAQAGEAYSCMSIIGIEGYPVENITFEDVSVEYAGGMKKALIPDTVPVCDYCYPEYFRWGTLPAYGLYARQLAGLYLKNVTLKTAKHDERCAVVMDSVWGLREDGLCLRNALPE